MDLIPERSSSPGVFDNGYDAAISEAAKNPAERPPAGIGESFVSSFGQTVREDVPFVSSATFESRLSQKQAERNALIEKVTGAPFTLTPTYPVPQAPDFPFTAPNVDALQYKKTVDELSAAHPEIKNDDELRRELIQEYRQKRSDAAKVSEASHGLAAVGEFAGSAAASQLNPLYLAILPLGASVSAGIVKTALTNAGIVGAAEALSQPFTYRFKKEIGSEYGVGEAVTNVAAAAAGAGILTGGIKAAEVGIRRLLPRVHGVDDLVESFDRNVTKPSTIEQDARFVLGDYSNVVRESPFHLNDPAAGEAHFNAVGKATGDMLDNKPVDVGDIVKGLEPRPELKAEPATVIPELASPPIAKADLNLDGEFKGLALKEDLGVKEVQARAERILSEGDIQLPTGLLTEAEGQLRPVMRSAREILQEADQDLSVGAILKKCLTGG